MSEYFTDSIDFKNLSPEQKKHLKKILKKEVDYLEFVLENTLIELCYACKHAVYEEGLGLYEIRCKRDGKVYDENAWCEFQEYDPNYLRVNPRIN